MAGDQPNSLQTLAHRTSGDPQEFEWSFQIDHPFEDEMLCSDVRCKLGHNLDVNLGSRSDIIETGTPWSMITSSTYNFTNLSTESVIFIGKNKADFVSQSTTTIW